MSELQVLERKLDQLTILVEAMLRHESIHEVAGYAYGRTSIDAAFIILYPAASQLKHKVCRVYEEDFGKLPAFINTNIPAVAQEGNPDREQAKRQRIYTHTPVFTITTVEGKDTQMGPEVRFSRVISAPVAGSAVPAGPGQQQPANPPTPLKARKSAVKTETGQTAVNGNAGQETPNTAENPDSAEHWQKEAAAAVEPLMFDTAVSRLEPWFKDADAVESFRSILFPEWQPDKSLFCMKALLKYAEVRKTLDGRYPTSEAHKKAKTEAHNVFNRLSADKDAEE